jgi:hypothetical protein
LKRARLLTVLTCLIAAGPVIASQARGQQPSAPFYNVDAEKQIEGTILDLAFEPRYKDRAPFLILIIEEKSTGEVYRAEISPAWFFDYDVHKGESVRIIGSTYTQDDSQHIIARRLQCGGETFYLRDSRGFPNWRGGQMKRGDRHRGRGL